MKRRYEDKSVTELERMMASYFKALGAQLTTPTACMTIRAIAEIEDELDLRLKECDSWDVSARVS